MVEFMHQVVMKATRVVVQVAHYIALNCDEVSIVVVHYYVVQNWVRIPILISLDKVVVSLGNNNLTKVIMEALMIDGGFPRN
jgi:hypothetical protein